MNHSNATLGCSHETYALICFNVLMDGYKDKSPGYMREKAESLSEGLNAFAWLDWKTMAKAIAYCIDWKIPVPPEWTQEYELQVEAWRKMGLIDT